MSRFSVNPERVECVRWSPGSRGRLAAGAALLLLCSVGALAQDDVDDPPVAPTVSVRPSAELRYTAGSGQVFELQGSNDLTHWRHIRDVVFGEGSDVSDFIPKDTIGSSEGFRFFRVVMSPLQRFGFAPKFLIGRKIDFNDEGAAAVLRFTSRAAGNSGAAPFAYSYRKTGDTSAELVIELGEGEVDSIELDFTADLVGLYTKTNSLNGAVKDIDKGTFSLGRLSDASPDPPATVAPESLVGQTYLFSDGDIHERVDFVTAAGGRAVDRADVVHFTYDFSHMTATAMATATVHYPGDVAIEYAMQFGGQACGTYLRREIVDGEVEHISEGVFSSAASVYHSSGAESTDVTLPADELAGRTYVMRDGGTPCHIQFQNHVTGKCVRGRQVDDIHYDYVVNCNATSTITVHMADGKYDRYHLNHTDETFVRHEVRDGVTVDTDTGTFSESL